VERIEDLIDRLQNGTLEERILAAERLGKVHAPMNIQTLMALVEALKHPDERLCYQSAKSLVWLVGYQRGLKLLEHENPEVRHGTIWALDELKLRKEQQEWLIPVLQTCLSDKHGAVRAATAYLLGRLGANRAVEGLIELLEDDHPLAQMNALDALGQLKDPKAFDALVARLHPPYAFLCADALGKLGKPEAIPFLIPLLEDPDPTVQGSATLAILKLDQGACTAELLAHPKEIVRLICARGLSEHIDHHSFTSFTMRASSNRQVDLAPPVRRFRKLVPTLIERLGCETNPRLRSLLVKLLGQLQASQALSLLSTLLAEAPEEEIRAAAALALGCMEDSPPLRSSLQKAQAEDLSPDVQTAVQKALARLDFSASTATLGSKIVPKEIP
jgi:HEAT repeat protein